MIGLIVALLPLLPTSSTCLTNYGKTACGYACLAAHGDVSCARTPLGVCKATSDAPTVQGRGVVCWDPPEHVRAHYGERAPRPDCVMRRGDLTCGYHCEASGADADCATTPDGICRATSRGVVCWDPPVTNYCADDKPLPRPECIVSDAYVACGHHCEARNGQLACASTPDGRCTMNHGEFVCTDPAPPPFCGARPCDVDRGERSWCPAAKPDGKRK